MDQKFLKLSDIPTGNECLVVKVHGHGSFRNRIIEMGFVKGEKVTVIKNAPLKDPIEYKLMDCHLSLRRSEADLIEVMDVTDHAAPDDTALYNGTLPGDSFKEIIRTHAHTVNVALVGNPNSGKTSFFNRAAGMREKVGNYGGVTVDAKKAVFKYKNYTINLIDLPGTYSITEYTPEEIYVRKYISEEHPDVVLNVVDASNLERNLFLTTQLIDMNIRMVMALNMYDELSREGAVLDYHFLEQLFGFPIVPTTASSGVGIDQVLERVIEVFEDRSEVTRHIHIHYGEGLEEAIDRVKTPIASNKVLTDKFAPRYLAIKALESDRMVRELLEKAPNFAKIDETSNLCIQELTREYKEDVKTLITNAKYGFIRGALNETFTEGKRKRHLTNAIDTVLTNQWLGFPVLLFFMWVMFQATFYLGEFPMTWIDNGMAALGDWVGRVMAPGPLNDLVVNGIIAGVGGVLVFLPNILILFFFISLLEDTGYMARAAFIMDKLMHKIGLHGKSFIPLLIGFGCNVPAIMATRTLESRRDRLLTMLITPFMSCSARLPVYILLVSAFFAAHRGLVLLSIYAAGVVVAICTALLLKNTLFKKVSAPFVMELPPYRMPTLRNTVTHMWNKGVQYLRKMGTIILFASVIIWALGYFPQDSGFAYGTPEHLEHSYIGRIGKTVEPVIAPLGFDWKMGVSIVTGLAAKEIVVSSMGILYHAPDTEENTAALTESIRPEFTPLVAYGFMLFVLIYFPCMAVVAAIRKEAGGKWALFTIVYTTALAWVVSFLVHRIGILF
ncbi:MAG: ferrous iron transport protein B [Culturomica sp.]|jgi:ferrous iron transport protein B|nr:ferrous iron transport protein B [Culturomica sp.]